MGNGLNFFETSAAALYKQFIEELQKNTGEKMYEGDERLIFAQSFLTVIVALFNTFNEAAKSRMIAFAHGEILDAIGEFKECKRLQPNSARCILQLSTNRARPESIRIPAGTKATADGVLIFATIKECIIPAGELSTTVEAACTTGGSKGNGIPAGAISTLIDNVLGVTGATNTSATAGGDDGEPYPYDPETHPDGDNGEGDNRYRERIILSNSAHSPAGSENGYIYWAKTASSEIVDVRVISEQKAGTIELVVMTKDGTATEEIINKVLETCNAKDVRPMNDIVTVIPPEIISYDIELEYTIMDGDQNRAIDDISGEKGACTRFAEYTGAKLGRDINPDLLHFYAMQSATGEPQGAVMGCKVILPEARELLDNQVARWSGKLTLHEPTVKFK